MTAEELVSTIQGRGIELWADDGMIHFRGTLTDNERTALREAKPAVLDLLRTKQPHLDETGLYTSR